MKTNKFKKTTPVTEVKTTIPGSVGEFIKVLEEFPEDGKFTLDGCVHISDALTADDGENLNVTIYPKEAVPECIDCKSPEDCVEEKTYEDKVLDGYFFGLAVDHPEVVLDMRAMNGNALTEAGVMVPTKEELAYESQLLPYQQDMIDQIRRNNMYVAECCAEIHRREIAALLEYQTQCIARFGVETNRDMCIIVNPEVED